MTDFIIKDQNRKFYVIEHIKSLPFSPVRVVTIAEYKKHRTKAQNNTFHLWCDLIAKEVGEAPEYIKDKLKLACFGTFQRSVGGKILTELKPSSSLDTKDFSVLMEATQSLANQLNILLPWPDTFLETLR